MTLPKLNFSKKQTNIIILLIIAIIIAIFFTYLSNREKQEPRTDTSIIQIKQANYQNILPGESKLEDVEKKFGSPISSVISSTGTIYQFESGNKYLPHEVVIDGEDTVQYINRHLVEIPKENQIQKLTKELNETPTVLYSQSSLSGVNLYVFPKSGLALEATQKSGLGLSIKYFSPADLITIIEKHFPNHSKTFDPEKYHD